MECGVRHSPRITELAQLRAEHENEQQRHREVQLLNNRTLVKAKRDSMSKEEKDALLEKRRNDYRLRIQQSYLSKTKSWNGAAGGKCNVWSHFLVGFHPQRSEYSGILYVHVCSSSELVLIMNWCW
ncbi:hypothetical protein MKW92_002247 [Papaver armeniacum]|nr:hypothetical protein MKW92_002247 [Papaver armeniacum]